MFGAAEVISKRVAAAQQQVPDQVFGRGEIVPGLQALDSVQNGTVQCCTPLPITTSEGPPFAFGPAIRSA